jgi:hypothetical protein
MEKRGALLIKFNAPVILKPLYCPHIGSAAGPQAPDLLE